MSELVKFTDLEVLAERINAEHEATEAAFSESLQHARRAGSLLIEAKSEVPHGEWLPWLEVNCQFAVRTAQVYMRIERNWAELSNTQGLAILGVESAAKLLAVPKDAEPEQAELNTDAILAGLEQRLAEVSSPEEALELEREAEEIYLHFRARYRSDFAQRWNMKYPGEFEQHEISKFMPPFPDEDFLALRASIAKNGQLMPITLYEGKVLDGWHRYLACKSLDIGPITRVYEGEDPLGVFLSANFYRKHYTEAEKAAIKHKLEAHKQAKR